MKTHLSRITVVMVAAATLSGCVTGPFPSRTSSKVAIITAGYFRGATSFGPEISVTEVDGVPTDKPHGPIVLEPGMHTVAMKCGDTIKNLTVKAAAGEVYQFRIITTPGVRGCTGSLARVRPANKLS